MHLRKALFFVAFIVLPINNGVYGKDGTCYTTCLVVVYTGAVIATPLALLTAGFGVAGATAGTLAAKMIAKSIGAKSWDSYFKSDNDPGNRQTGSMVSRLCANVCGSKEEGISDL